ncbi:MAG: pyridoxal phosphate-dependent aminotransferase [Candidatus Altiarchaeota archaeon]|nr:pyridoxal phosphate-dependent aminotransferase [Candidatus Altiarchaeota archaeon]
MLKLTRHLADIVPDPVRHWINVDKELGAKHMFTIGEPDPIPKDMLAVYAKAVYDEELSGKVSYPPVAGEESLRKAIVGMEKNFNVNYAEDDASRIYVTAGGSQGLQFAFSLFRPGSEIIAMTPCWGTIFNMTAHSGVKGVPAELFKDGRFVKENAEKALSDNTQAVYVNFPANPNGIVLKEKVIKEFADWAVAHDLQIISDAPYKYLIYEPGKTPYVSPLNCSPEAGRKTTEISSFSKIIKPDIRLGYLRIAPEILEHPEAKRLLYYFRNLSAGASRPAQAGVTAVLNKDPKLGFLKPMVKNYKEKAEVLGECLEKLGCTLTEKPAGGYFLFPQTPDGMDGEEYVKKTAAERKVGFIPGSSFGGSYKGFENLKKYFRAGFGGGWTKEKIREVFN